MAGQRIELAAVPVSRGKLFWTWDGSLSYPFGRLPARMHIAGYILPEQRTGLVVISPLQPTDEVTSWLKATGDVCFIVAPNKVPENPPSAPHGSSLNHKNADVVFEHS